MSERFVRRDETVRITGIPVSTIYELMNRGTFPRPVRISPRLVAWRESELQAWMRARIDERDQKAST